MPDVKETAADRETAALAATIAGEPTPDIIEKADEVVAPTKPPKAASEEKVEKPVSEEKLEGAEGEPDQEGAEEDEVKPEEDTKFFEGVDLSKPEEAVKALLKHPALGPQLQHWSDSGVKPQVEQQVAEQLEAERPSIAASVRRTAQEKQEDEHFASMSKEDLNEELTENPKAAAAYARYQQRLQSATGRPDPKAIVRTAETYAVANQMFLNTRLVEDSDFSQETKERLKAENFASQGREGLLIWGQEIFKAYVEQEAAKLQGKDLEARWEAFKQEHLAEVDGDRPPTGPGRRASAMPDIMETPSTDLFDLAFQNRKPDKPEGAK